MIARALSGPSLDVVQRRARLSEGTSSQAIYRMVAGALASRSVHAATLVDIGCGRGDLIEHVRPFISRYVGVDAVRYDALPQDVEFVQADADHSDGLTRLAAAADVVVAVETIEHLENPRTLVRQMSSIVRPGGWIIVTTPNQLSLLSLLSLVVKGQFSHFQDAHYPAHLTALLPVDLRRLASEVQLADVSIEYSFSGRIALTPFQYPAAIARVFPRRCSDNVMLVGRRVA